MERFFMNMQIAITGRGGQGVLFLTRILSECALNLGLEGIASETHGMAMRGGSVISTLKVGSYRGPLIRSGQADLILALDEGSVETYAHLLAPHGVLILNAVHSSSSPFIDATGMAAGIGSPLMANLILLGFSLKLKKLFCDYPLAASVTKAISPERFREDNLKALRLGYSAGHPEGRE
jgi:indolepyruvate ferredoxin oxidoreductase beta subunit